MLKGREVESESDRGYERKLKETNKLIDEVRLIKPGYHLVGLTRKRSWKLRERGMRKNTNSRTRNLSLSYPGVRNVVRNDRLW